jgi:hypothetical protein
MIRYDMKQGSPEWNRIRRGKPTASEFERILSPTGKVSAQKASYFYRKLAERLGFEVENITSAALAYGHEMEPQAVRTYEALLGVETESIGFATDDRGRYGASPDRILSSGEGILQVKCPYTPWVHLEYFGSPGGGALKMDHYPQIQGEMLVTGAQWCDLISYYPSLPMVRIRVDRDQPYLDTLRMQLELFCNDLDRMEREVREHPETCLPEAA